MYQRFEDAFVFYGNITMMFVLAYLIYKCFYLILL